MHNIALIARREYLEQVRGKAFRLSTMLVPAAFLLIIGIMYMANRNAGGNKPLYLGHPEFEGFDVVQEINAGLAVPTAPSSRALSGAGGRGA